MREACEFLRTLVPTLLVELGYGVVVLVLLVVMAPTLALYLFIVVSCAVGVAWIGALAVIIGHQLREFFHAQSE